MYARVSTLEGPAEGIARSVTEARDEIVPQAAQLAGWLGYCLLVDRASGKQVIVTFWESDDAMRRSEEAADRLRQQTAETGADEIRAVERFEVALYGFPA